jgi:hypothetical protein
MADWHPNAIRQPLGGGTYTGGKPKIVWHTTEGSTYPGPQIYHGTNPHFTCDFKQRKLYQHTPISQAARALAHPAGTGDTNNDNCVQIELVGFAAESGTKWSVADYAYIADLARWIEANHGVPNKAIMPWGAPRFTWPFWHAFSGHCGHRHVPSNDHTDPGTGFRIQLVLAGGKTPDPRVKKWRRQLRRIRTVAKFLGWLPGLKRAAENRKRWIREHS